MNKKEEEKQESLRAIKLELMKEMILTEIFNMRQEWYKIDLYISYRAHDHIVGLTCCKVNEEMTIVVPADLYHTHHQSEDQKNKIDKIMQHVDSTTYFTMDISSKGIVPITEEQLANAKVKLQHVDGIIFITPYKELD